MKFITFLHDIKQSNPLLIESIISAYYLIESINPIKPNKITYSKKIVNKDTNRAFETKNASFTTSLGNKVVVSLFLSGDAHEIVFSVNGSQYEDTERSKDIEILPKVIWLSKHMLDKYNIDKFYLKAVTDDNDNKFIKDIEYKDLEDILIYRIHNILNIVKTLDFSDMEYTDFEKNFMKKYNKVIDKNKNKKFIITRLSSILDNLDNISYLQHNNDLSLLDEFSYCKIDNYKELNELYKKYRINKLSNLLPNGYKISNNRRYNIYKRLMDKYFSDWNIKFDDRLGTIEGYR